MALFLQAASPFLGPPRVPGGNATDCMGFPTSSGEQAAGGRVGWEVAWSAEPGAAVVELTLTLYPLEAERKEEKELAYRHGEGRNRTLMESNPT